MRNKEELIAEMKKLKHKVEVSIEKRMSTMEKQIIDNTKDIKTIHNELNIR